jgi:hypothetical protein
MAGYLSATQECHGRSYLRFFCIQVLLDQRNRTRKSPARPGPLYTGVTHGGRSTERGHQSLSSDPPVVPGPVFPPPPATASRAPRRSPFRPQMEPKKSSAQRQPHAMEPNKSSLCGATAPAATAEAESPLCSLFYPPVGPLFPPAAPAPGPDRGTFLDAPLSCSMLCLVLRFQLDVEFCSLTTLLFTMLMQMGSFACTGALYTNTFLLSIFC